MDDCNELSRLGLTNLQTAASCSGALKRQRRRWFSVPISSSFTFSSSHCDVLRRAASDEALGAHIGELRVLWLVESVVHAADAGIDSD